jgi:uncharacterized protein YutE (UPF0331/DUF86 family)
MTKLAVVENKISAVRKYLKILENYQQYSKEEIEKDLTLRGAVERYLYLAAQSTIDLGEAIIAYRDFRKPATMSEVFYILNEEKIISDKLAEKMVKMTGFRNIVVHDYEKINYDIVYDVLTNKLEDIEEFLRSIKLKIR